MKILKDVVKSVHNTSFNGILIQLKPTSQTLYESIYDYEFDIGDMIEHDNKSYEILDISLSTPNIVGGRTWYVKVKQIEI
jgi:carbonic anhydrase